MARTKIVRYFETSHHSWGHRFMDMFKNTRIALFAIAATAIAFNHLGAIDTALDFLGRGHIAEANTVYLHQTKLKMGESIIVLTSLDTAFEVLKSSSAGISFIVDVDVQVGNIVATLQDLTNKALMASIAAAASLIGIELILKLGNLLSAPILTLTIMMLGLHYIVRSHWRLAANISGQLSEILILFTLIIHLGLPLVIYGSSLASAALTSPMAQQAQVHFTQTHASFKVAKEGKISAHVKAVINRYKSTSEDTHRKGRSLSGSVVRHMVALLFDAFLFPALLLGTIIWVSKIVIRHTLKVDELIKSSDPRTLGIKRPRKILRVRR